MARETGNRDQATSQSDNGVKRRGLLKFGSLITAITGASAISAIGAGSAEAGPGDKTPTTTYVPVSEKGAPLGVATLDIESKIPRTLLPDLSTTFGPDSIPMKNTFGSFLSVKAPQFGAVGDGVADDTWAIQAAINAAAVQSVSSGAGAGKVVYFPAGRYKVTSTLLVPTGTVLQGSSGGIWSTSRGESRIFKFGSSTSLIANDDQVNCGSNIEIRNLKLMGAGGSVLDFKASGAGGVDGTTCRRILIIDCFITNTAGNGVTFSDVQVSLIRGCYIAGNTGHSIHFKSSYDNEVTGCQIDTYQSATDTFGGDGIHMDNTGSGGYSDYNIIHNNFIFLCSNGIGITNARGNVISGNRINTCNYGILMQTFGGGTNVERNLVTGNVFYDHGYKSGGVGVLIDGTAQYNTVTGNQFSREVGSITFNYAVQTGARSVSNVVIGNAARNLVQGKSYNNSSTLENTYTNNSVAERGMRVSTVLTVAGAIAFDASLADSSQVTLHANATSSTLINGHQGQQITISWLQDATGGWTYSWPTNCRFAGAAPTDTTANRQTSVTFVKGGTLWMETGRAVQVG